MTLKDIAIAVSPLSHGGTAVLQHRFGQITDQKWTNNSTAVDEYGYAYDYDGNRKYRQNSGPGASSLDEAYTYDDLDRVTDLQRGTLSGSTISGMPAREQQFTPDELGNWPGYLTKTSGTTDLTQTRTHGAVNETTGITGGSWTVPTYDLNGNITSAPKPPAPITNYQLPITRLPSSPTPYYDYYYNENWQVLEERKGGSTNPYAQYVWDARYIDAPVVRFRDSNTDGTLDDTLYYATDANMNVTALVDTGGTVQERYTYDAYGQVHISDGSWGTRTSSSYDNQILFGGYRYDPETSLYHVRNRMYHPTLGRWGQRDPLGYIDSMNRYLGLGDNLINRIDPTGEDWSRKGFIGAVAGGAAAGLVGGVGLGLVTGVWDEPATIPVLTVIGAAVGAAGYVADNTCESLYDLATSPPSPPPPSPPGPPPPPPPSKPLIPPPPGYEWQQIIAVTPDGSGITWVLVRISPYGY